MRSSGINGEGELTRQPTNPGSPGKMAVETTCVCAGLSGRVVRELELQSNQLRVRISAAMLLSTILCKLLTHVPLSPSSIIWYQTMGGDALQLGR